MFSTRWYWLGLIGSAALLATAYFYFQQRMGLIPCSLCMVQRAALVGVMFFCLVGVIFRPGNFLGKLLALGVTLSSLLGLLAAGRQAWLQHLPAEQVPECGPDLTYMLEAFPLMEVITTVFSGSGECAKAVWHLFGFSMGEWMLLVFAIMTLISFRLLFSKPRQYFSNSY